ncbi:MAG TPA: hypothetical protein VF361_01965, partial [Candidatus Limnocylindrales bacterium]
GLGLTGPGRAEAATPSTAPITSAGGAVSVVPGVGATTLTGGGTTVAQAAAAIAYPYYGGSPGIAPDQVIVLGCSMEISLG